jgi:hypothetical protein
LAGYVCIACVGISRPQPRLITCLRMHGMRWLVTYA